MAGRVGVTIADVARLAGVSSATVSRALNGHPSVTAETEQKVRQAAGQLDYVPSNVARSLSLGRTHTVALLMPDLSNPMFQQVLRGVNRAAAAEGYRVLVTDSIEDPDREAELAIEARRRCDALILCSPRMSAPELHRVLAATQPVVLVNREAEAGATPSVIVDYATGVRLLTERLIDLGHRRLLYLAGPAASLTNAARVHALRAVERENPGVAVEVVACGGSIEDGSAALGPVLASGATAVIAYNDVIAFGLLGKLNEAGVRIPQDLSLAGFDDISFARYSTPPLTTMAVPQTELGRLAFDQLTRVLEGATDLPVLRFTPRLAERGSIGLVPRESVEPRLLEESTAPFAWHRDEDVAATLELAGSVLARYERRPVMPDLYSPRPYLHPLYTLAGVPLTAASPPLHRHQHGLSFAVPLVNGTSYWGGRTHVRDVGPVLLPNHGSQLGHDATVAGTELTERLRWHAEDGAVQLEEERVLTAQVLADNAGWRLRWRSELTATPGRVVIESPHASGRADAGYGGIFWRFADAEGVEAFTAGGVDPHGARTPWLVLRCHGERPWSVVLTQVGSEPVPWHVRLGEYVAAGPAIAWDGPIIMESGQRLAVGLDAVILDRAVTTSEVSDLLEV
ncbi:PmoA family protein [Ruania alkalisoli]|uniref:PmoA family protein n=1 Tax=Ruania alkalisoli TaxID=2779775 RepID=A0A7M1SXY9_9MICO|nr:DUF6807 family protein [Ruania alkalisoli]QOR71493.1 PmoA family protein [Ruania alkalisoli]